MSQIQRVLAIIVDYQSAKQASELSAQIARGDRDGFEVTVVHLDNGNPEPTRLTDEQRALGVELIASGFNGGYASALNFAVQSKDPDGDRFDAYWFLNSDLRVEPDCLARLVEVLNRNAEVAAAGPIVKYGDTGRIWGARGVVNPLLGITAMTDWSGGILPRWSYIPGCSLLVRASAYRSVDGLPERYRLYFEETEFCIRLQKRGGELWVERSAVAYHLVNSRESGLPARHFAFYFARNNLYFWKHNFGIPWPVQLPRMAFVILKELVLPLRHARSIDEARDRLNYIWAGIRDGFAFLSESRTEGEKRLFPGIRSRSET